MSETPTSSTGQPSPKEVERNVLEEMADQHEAAGRDADAARTRDIARQ